MCLLKHLTWTQHGSRISKFWVTVSYENIFFSYFSVYIVKLLVTEITNNLEKLTGL